MINGHNTGREIKLNIIIYVSFLLFAIIGIIYGNSLSNKFSFLRIWDYQNILIATSRYSFFVFTDKSESSKFFE